MKKGLSPFKKGKRVRVENQGPKEASIFKRNGEKGKKGNRRSSNQKSEMGVYNSRGGR